MGDDPYENLEKDMDAINAWLDKYRVEPMEKREQPKRLCFFSTDPIWLWIALVEAIFWIAITFGGIFNPISR